MPRTLDPILQDGLDNNKGSPFFTVYLWTGAAYVAAQPTKYELFNLTAKVTFVYNNSLLATQWFYISRGLRIDGINYPVLSSKYYRSKTTSDLRTFITIEAHIFDNLLVSTPGDTEADLILAEVMNQSLKASAQLEYQNTISFPTSAPWWQNAQFYPNGRTLTAKAQNLESLLRQKYLAQLCEIGDNELTVVSSSQFEDPYLFSFDQNQILAAQKVIQFDKGRKFVWRDENGTIHASGDANLPIHNLGYIESTIDPSPAFGAIASSIEYVEVKHAMPNLAIVNGDPITIDNDISIHILVKETFDIKKEPAWYMELIPINWISNTEGGALPSTIEAAAPYTPLNVSPFHGILSAEDNNIQAAMETIDDHEHTGAGITQEEVEDYVGNMFSGNTETGITATYDDTTGKINLVAEVTQAELDAVSASIPSTEAIQDIVGAMFTGNTETNITADYQDSAGTIDLIATTGNGSGIFGDGSDGDVTISADTILTKDMNYGDLTISSGFNLDVNAYIVRVSGTLTIEATAKLHCNGDAGSNGAQNSPSAAAGGKGGGQKQGSTARKAITGIGGNGGSGGSVTSTGTANAAGTAGASSSVSELGTGTQSNLPAQLLAGSGGPGGGAHGTTPQQGIIGQSTRWGLSSAAPATSGAGTGTGNVQLSGGAGGGGAGPCIVYAKTIDNAGIISANGGQGGNGVLSGSTRSGNGSGGSGGIVHLIYQSTTGSGVGTLQANAGTAGTGGNGGGSGQVGKTYSEQV